MRLSQLTGLRMDQLHAEYEEIEKRIAYLQQILDDPELCKKVMKDELQEVKEKYGDERRTEIKYSSEEFNPEDFYPNDPVVITISHLGLHQAHTAVRVPRTSSWRRWQQGSAQP